MKANLFWLACLATGLCACSEDLPFPLAFRKTESELLTCLRLDGTFASLKLCKASGP